MGAADGAVGPSSSSSSNRRDNPPQRSQTMPIVEDRYPNPVSAERSNRNGVLWENQRIDHSGGYDFPQPRAPGLFSQPNHSSPTLASRAGGGENLSPTLDDLTDHPSTVPSVDDINLGLENMSFQQRDPIRTSQGLSHDGAMEIRGNEGNTASVYSLDGAYGYPQQHQRRESRDSGRLYGNDTVDGYSDNRPHSGGSYLPYDQPQGGSHQFHTTPPPPLPNQQGYSDFQQPPHPSTSSGQQPYYPDPSGYGHLPYSQQPPQQYGLPPGPQSYSSQAPPSFQPQPQHGGPWGFEYSNAAAQNPYYAAATGQLGFPDNNGQNNGYVGPPQPPMPFPGGMNRNVSGASSMLSLGAGTMPGGGGGQGGGSLNRSASSVNLPPSMPPSRNGGGRQVSNGSQSQQSSGPPINKASVDEYRTRIKSDPDPEAQFNFAKYLIEAAKKISASSSGDEKSAKKYRDALLAESVKLIKRLATQGVGLGKPAYADAQFFLANCLGNGSLGLQVDHEKAYNLYVQASKQNHPSATYRTAVCNEVGAGTRRDHARAVLFYRKASALGDTAGMYKLGMILLNGLLGQNKNPKEAVIWLKRAAQQADEDNPHALHELGLLYEKAPPPGQPGPLASILAFDPAQARQLFNDAATYNYAPSQYKLGLCFEYGTLTCPVDPRRSIAWYTRAAERGDAESELALSGWYLTGSDGILKQSDSEAYLWARRAANKGLPKAEYAVGYYSEVGIGVKQDLEEAKRWYMRAAAQGNKRAMTRLQELRELMKKEGSKGGKVAKPDARKR